MENKILTHLVKYQKSYLPLLALIILSLPVLVNLSQPKSFFTSGESYFFLAETEDIHYRSAAFLPLSVLNYFLPEGGMAVISLLIALLSLFLFLELAKQRKLPAKFSFFFLLFFILSPAFIWSYTNISFYSYYLLLLLPGFLLLEQKKKKWCYLSLPFFILGTFFDIFSSVMIILLLTVYFFFSQREENQFPLISLTLIGFFAFLNALLAGQPFILGPFHQVNHLADLISDLGGLSGIGFFTLLLAFIGFLISWRYKNSYVAYFFLPFLLSAYWFNTNTILLLSLLTAFFAATGFLKLLEWKWSLAQLKKITFLLLILGVIFSAVSYLDRVDEKGPTREDLKAYQFLKGFLKEEALSDAFTSDFVIFTAPENSYFLKYYTGQEAFYYPHTRDKARENISQSILGAGYVDDLFPLLEENRIALLYLTPRMKSGLPKDYGLLFLLKNERFKLIYASGGDEVWAFEPEIALK